MTLSVVQQQAAIVAELRAVGYDVDSVYALRARYTDYRSAIPVLVRWLPEVDDFGLKETLLRNLAVRFARTDALEPLIAEFAAMDTSNDPTGWQLRWAAGNSLEVLWDDRCFDELRALCIEPAYGRGREMVVRGMGKSKRPEAAATLIDLLDDDVVRVPAIVALRKVRPVAARTPLERIRADQERWVQREIDRTLDKLPV